MTWNVLTTHTGDTNPAIDDQHATEYTLTHPHLFKDLHCHLFKLWTVIGGALHVWLALCHVFHQVSSAPTKISKGLVLGKVKCLSKGMVVTWGCERGFHDSHVQGTLG